MVRARRQQQALPAHAGAVLPVGAPLATRRKCHRKRRRQGSALAEARCGRKKKNRPQASRGPGAAPPCSFLTASAVIFGLQSYRNSVCFKSIQPSARSQSLLECNIVSKHRQTYECNAPSANARGREVGREGGERGREVLGIGVWGRVGESSTTAGRCFGARLGCYGWLSALSQPNGLTGLARRLNAGE